jgi:hypothetical protein
MLEILRYAFVFVLGLSLGAHCGIHIAFEAIKKALEDRRREDSPQVFRCSECHRREGKLHRPYCHERRTGEIVAERREDGPCA